MAEKIPGWIERLLLPRLSSLEGEIKAFRGEAAGDFKAMGGRIDGVERRFDGVEKQTASLRNEMNGRIDGVEKRIDSVEKRIDNFEGVMMSLRNEMSARFDTLDTKVTLVEDVTRLKIEVKALTEKIAAISSS